MNTEQVNAEQVNTEQVNAEQVNAEQRAHRRGRDELNAELARGPHRRPRRADQYSNDRKLAR